MLSVPFGKRLFGHAADLVANHIAEREVEAVLDVLFIHEDTNHATAEECMDFKKSQLATSQGSQHASFNGRGQIHVKCSRFRFSRM